MKKTGVKKISIIKNLLFGALIGGMIGYFVPKSYEIYQNHHFNQWIDMNWLLVVITLCLTILFTMISKYLFYKVHQAITQDQYDVDEMEEQTYKKLLKQFYMSQCIGSSAVIFNTLFMSASYLLLESNQIYLMIGFIITAIILMVINTRNLYVLLDYSKYFYNIDEQYDWADKQTMYQLIDHIDDGERLMMLQSLYKSYEKMILISMFSMMLLSFYQVISNNNQILAMCCFTFMLIYATYCYYKNLKKYIH